jgi:hypothetical protein
VESARRDDPSPSHRSKGRGDHCIRLQEGGAVEEERKKNRRHLSTPLAPLRVATEADLRADIWKQCHLCNPTN